MLEVSKELIQKLIEKQYEKLYYINLNEDYLVVIHDSAEPNLTSEKKVFSTFYDEILLTLGEIQSTKRWLVPIDELRHFKDDQFTPKVTCIESEEKDSYIEYCIIPVKRNEDGTLAIYLLTIRDVTSNVEDLNVQSLYSISNKVVKESFMDSVTKIYNTNYLRRFIELLVETKEIMSYSLVLVNIRNFSLINDYFGTKIGDKLLKSLAKDLIALKPYEKTVVCHHYADNFLILTKASIEDIKRITEQITYIYSHYDLPIKIKLKYGVYPFKEEQYDFNEILLRVRLTCDKIKEDEDVHLAIYDNESKDNLMRRQVLLNNFRDGINRKEFIVHYQPIYDAKNEEIVFAEALVRWNNSQLGLVSPGEFIPLFERNGLITELDRYVLRTVFDDIKKAKADGVDFPKVSVNFSRNDVYSMNFKEMIEHEFNTSNTPFSRVHLEVTESAFIADKKALIQTIKEMRNVGFEFWMDDFGSEYSTLNALKDFDVSTLKLDLKFFDGFETNEKSQKIITSVIKMAKCLNLKILAEGIETKNQLEFLKNSNCDLIQGYIYSKPVPYETFITMFQKQKNQSNICSEPLKLDFKKN